MGLQSAGANTAAIGISVEGIEQVDAQMTSLKSKGETLTTAPDMDGMQVEGGGSGADSMALIRPGSTDVAMQANMALALAPRIGEWNLISRHNCRKLIFQVSHCSHKCLLLSVFIRTR